MKRKLNVKFWACLSILFWYTKDLNAQQTGHFAPDFMGFEPVDIPDMVNLSTGDLVYSLPLLNIPTNDGRGYPISMSNYSGIVNEQEATWVGLGWRLNNGALNRSVSNAPDDVDGFTGYSISMATETKEYSSLNFNFGKFIPSLSYSWGDKQGFNGQVALGKRTYSLDGSSSSSSMSLGITNKQVISMLAGNSGLNNVSSVMSSGVSALGVSMGEVQSSNMSSAGGVYQQHETSSLALPHIPVSFTRHRVTLTQSNAQSRVVYGGLYPGQGNGNGDGYTTFATNESSDNMPLPFDKWAFNHDWYNTEQARLMLPAYDAFSVSGQGISHSFQAKYKSTGLLFGSTGNTNGDSFGNEAYKMSWSGNQGRLKNDYIQFLADYPTTDNWRMSSARILEDINTSYIDNDLVSVSNTNGYIDEKFGGTHVEWFTNGEIVSNGLTNAEGLRNRGFIDIDAVPMSKRSNDMLFPSESIGGFSITNEAGVTYHYSIPVYQREKISSLGTTYTIHDKVAFTVYQDPYAVSWLLTSITGSDYVDANNNYKIDEEDYGYWVKFDYGQFSDGYLWLENKKRKELFWGEEDVRVPSTKGFKDIYYLNSIKTKTHTAFFVKGERKDGLGFGSTATDYTDFNTIDDSDNLGAGCSNDEVDYQYRIKFAQSRPHKLMKLERIILLKNEDAHLVNYTSGSHDNSGDAYYVAPSDINEVTMGMFFDCNFTFSDAHHYGLGTVPALTRYINTYQMDNIFDFKDYEVLKSQIESKALKVIEFDYGYDLMKGSENTSASTTGKLSLNWVKFLSGGKNSDGDHVVTQSLPTYEFEYYNLFDIDHNQSSYSTALVANKDDWGYYSHDYNSFTAHNWSLKSVKLPVGSKMEFEYEEDSYKTEYAFGQDLHFQVTNYKYLGSDSYGKKYRLFFPSRIGNNFNVGDVITSRVQYISKDNGDIDTPTNYTATITGIDSKRLWVDCIFFNDQQIGIELKRSEHIYTTSTHDFYHYMEPMAFEYFNMQIFKDTYSNPTYVKGGGTRVSSVKLNDLSGNIYKTTYDYEDENGLTSGVTSFSPKEYFAPEYIPYSSLLPQSRVLYGQVSVSNESVDGDSEIKTIYKFKVPTGCSNCAGREYKISDFFEVKDIEYLNYPVHSTTSALNTGFTYAYNSDDDYYYGSKVRRSQIKNNLSSIGLLMDKEVFNSKNQLVNKESNIYEASYDQSVGINEETFWTNRVNNLVLPFPTGVGAITIDKLTKHYLSSTTSHVKITPKLVGVKTSNSRVSNLTEYKDFDILTGKHTTVITKNSFGDIHRVTSTPAYKLYGELGRKVDDISNVNLLNASASTYTYIDNGDDDYTNDPVINASITTWKKDWNYRGFTGGKYQTVDHYPNAVSNKHKDIWRKHTTYSWRSKLDDETGAYLGADGALFNTDDEFRFDDLSLNSSKWVQNSEVTLYDHYSNQREVKDVNGQFASSKTWNGSTVSNIVGASYSGYCASGAEELQDGVNYTSGNVYFETETMLGGGASLHSNQVNVHTGSHSVKVTLRNIPAFVSKFQIPEDKFDPFKTYMLSVWVKGDLGTHYDHIELRIYPNSSVSNPIVISNPDIIRAGDWYQLRYTFQPVNHGYILVSPSEFKISIGTSSVYDPSTDGPIYFDDYRLYPIGASISTYVYDDMGRVEYLLGGNNLATKYVYDKTGRLKEVLSEVVGPDGGFVRRSSSTLHFVRDSE